MGSKMEQDTIVADLLRRQYRPWNRYRLRAWHDLEIRNAIDQIANEIIEFIHKKKNYAKNHIVLSEQIENLSNAREFHSTKNNKDMEDPIVGLALEVPSQGSSTDEFDLLMPLSLSISYFRGRNFRLPMYVSEIVVSLQTKDCEIDISTCNDADGSGLSGHADIFFRVPGSWRIRSRNGKELHGRAFQYERACRIYKCSGKCEVSSTVTCDPFDISFQFEKIEFLTEPPPEISINKKILLEIYLKKKMRIDEHTIVLAQAKLSSHIDQAEKSRKI